MPLQAIAEDLWLAEGPVVDFFGFPYPTRMVIVRLPDGGLWVWSPIALTQDLAAAVDALGPVAHLVSPNKLHHLFLSDWHRAYPAAALWAPRTTMRKRPDLPYAGELRETPPDAWGGVFDQLWLTESLFLDEVIFFHRPSRTCILADMSEAFDAGFLRQYWVPWKRWIARLWGITTERAHAPLEIRLSVLNRRAAREKVRRMLAWDPVRVVMAHGVWRDRDGRAFLARAFSWLGV